MASDGTPSSSALLLELPEHAVKEHAKANMMNVLKVMCFMVDSDFFNFEIVSILK